MLKKLQATLKKFNMLTKGETLLVAVSGGPDSVALLFALQELREQWQVKVKVIHVNHNLRGEDSLRDALFVEKLAGELGLACYIREVDVKGYWKDSGLSKQMAARELRYRLLEETAAEVGATRIALGHNANDQMETVLMNFLKGAGLEGLTGIPPVRGCYIRPLIEIPRAEIMAYCEDNHLQPVIDESNLEPIYLRNKIRLELIPLLEREYNPALLQGVQRLTEVLREEDELAALLTTQNMEEVVENNQESKMVLQIHKFNSLPVALQRRIIRHVWRELTGQSQGLHFDHVAEILNLAQQGQSGSSLDLAQGVKVRKSYNRLVFGYNEVKDRIGFFQYPLVVPGRTEIAELARVIETGIMDKDEAAHLQRAEGVKAFLDWEAFDGPLSIRRRQEGDSFQPLGAPGTKKLKDFFIDKKVPRWERDSIPVVCCGQRIVWVAGYSIAEPFKVREGTKKILCLELN